MPRHTLACLCNANFFHTDKIIGRSLATNLLDTCSEGGGYYTLVIFDKEPLA